MYKLNEFIMLEYDEVEDKAYLMNLEDGVMFELNPAAKMMVECIEETGNCENYIEKVVSEFGVDRAKAEGDCEKYIEHLLKTGCISNE